MQMPAAIKPCQPVATRYDKLAANDPAFIQPASIRLWLRIHESAPEMSMFPNAAIIGVGQSAYTRRPEPGQSTQTFMRDAMVAALKDAAIDARDIQGLAVSSFSLAPDAAVNLAWKLGFAGYDG